MNEIDLGTNAEPIWPDLEVGRLRVDSHDLDSMDAAFCSRCRCTKSGWADVPNVVTEWCENGHCPCHAEG